MDHLDHVDTMTRSIPGVSLLEISYPGLLFVIMLSCYCLIVVLVEVMTKPCAWCGGGGGEEGDTYNLRKDNWAVILSPHSRLSISQSHHGDANLHF